MKSPKRLWSPGGRLDYLVWQYSIWTVTHHCWVRNAWSAWLPGERTMDVPLWEVKSHPFTMYTIQWFQCIHCHELSSPLVPEHLHHPISDCNLCTLAVTNCNNEYESLQYILGGLVANELLNHLRVVWSTPWTLQKWQQSWGVLCSLQHCSPVCGFFFF